MEDSSILNSRRTKAHGSPWAFARLGAIAIVALMHNEPQYGIFPQSVVAGAEARMFSCFFGTTKVVPCYKTAPRRFIRHYLKPNSFLSC